MHIPENLAQVICIVSSTADRTFYTSEIVERLQARGVVSASEHWKADGDLPLPAQFLLETGRLVAQQPNGIRFRLISSWPIDRRNSPTTEFERTALAKILVNASRPYTGITTEGKASFFQAVYADKALSGICADCHNMHPKSPKEGFQGGRRHGRDCAYDSAPSIGKADRS